ncbi:LuxR family transcriptional regulator [Rhizobium rhizogenes]|uniref:helix-turn-helix transcriptional regulator n=1 Tax=Rhizobium rhizogenes TaxID=359 RepID=UPI0022B660A5|nr:LuxR family transcriptional regulator [Rhizobium rhizogenes]MCZ7448258.1 LuxR family transcriptional regulator [Rhizobium rhizogenes]MCZ7465691.1 LuxR family transcriptional regulator [Rhizobium rhizogenes]
MLSPLENACLRWVSQDRTLAEIASLEGKTIIEIEQHLERAMILLDANSIKEALDKAGIPPSE